MKIRTERIECYYANGSGKTRNYYFYIDFPRQASREEEAARKAFIKAIKQFETTKGRGYNWRVSVQTLRATVDFLPDPLAIKAEMQRFDREGVKPPLEPYRVRRIHVMDSEKPNIMTLAFDDKGPIPENFRRACDYWLLSHKLSRDERQRVSLFGGRHMVIVLEMLLAFETWLVFDKPWREMHEEAIQERRKMEEDIKERQRQEEEQFRAKYPNWDEWSDELKEYARLKYQDDLFEQMRERLRKEYQQNFRSFGFTGKSQLTESLELFGLSQSATLQDVKKRYRALSKQYHPDMPTGDEAQFKKINNANEILVQYLDRSK